MWTSHPIARSNACYDLFFVFCSKYLISEGKNWHKKTIGTKNKTEKPKNCFDLGVYSFCTKICVFLVLRESEHRNSMCDLWCEPNSKNIVGCFYFFRTSLSLKKGAFILYLLRCSGADREFAWLLWPEYSYWNTCSPLIRVSIVLLLHNVALELRTDYFFLVLRNTSLCLNVLWIHIAYLNHNYLWLYIFHCAQKN